MKKHIIYISFLVSMLGAGCTKNFNVINTDPTQLSGNNFDPNYLFTTGELGCANVTEYQVYSLSCATQILASTLPNLSGGDKYSSLLNTNLDRFFTEGYTNVGNLSAAITLAKQKDSVKYNNLIQISRILQVYQIQRITDIYGDVPYSQIGGTTSNIVLDPAYDSQSTIYPSLLLTLTNAIAKLDASKPLPTGDLLYGGNITQWQKFGNSLLLRVAMRLVKVDPATAQKYAEIASTNTFSSVNDDAVLKLDGLHDATTNKTANLLGNGGNVYTQTRWSQTFINYLNATTDPRRYFIAETADTGAAFNGDITHPGIPCTSKNPVIGMPNGYTLSQSDAFYIAKSPSYPGPTGTGTNAFELGNYARPVLSIFTSKSLPEIMITYAQTEFLLAEAKVRGWNINGSAAQHFTNGVKASLQSLAEYNNALTVPQDSINAFSARFPLDVSSTNNSLNQINSQYWVTCLFDYNEAWSNWRRTGYPVLTPVNYPNNITNGTIPRRLIYPPTEYSLNGTSLQNAISKLPGGLDVPTARVWWDK